MKRVDIIPQMKFKLGATNYLAVAQKEGEPVCKGCAFQTEAEKCFYTPPCSFAQRADRTNVIFIRETVK